MKNQTLTILIPAYNESNTILELLSRIERCGIPFLEEIIVINDGSTDATYSIVQEWISRNSNPSTPYRISLLNKSNGGKASAIRLGSEIANGTHVLIVDADLELIPEEILILWDCVLSQKSNIVFGIREQLSHQSYSWFYSKGNKLISNIFGFLYNTLVNDIMCGYKLIPHELLMRNNLNSKGFAIEIEIGRQAVLSGEKIMEVPVSYNPRTRAQGKNIVAFDGFLIILRMILRRAQELISLQKAKQRP